MTHTFSEMIGSASYLVYTHKFIFRRIFPKSVCC